MAHRGMIVAMTAERVIGLHGTLPWRHPGDLKRFQEVTRDSTVIMGRLTYESLPRKPLPRRRNLVVTRAAELGPGVECFASVAEALAAAGDEPVWFIGGARIFAAALEVCDTIDVTYVPDHVEHPEAVRFPEIDLDHWQPGPRITHELNAELERQVFTRRSPA